MAKQFSIHPELRDLRKRHLEWAEVELRPYYFGCRLKILFVADNFITFNDADFGLSEVITTLRGMSTGAYPVTVDLAHRHNPSASRLAGGTPNFTFSDDSLKGYDQVWIFASEYPSRDGPRPSITQGEQQAIRKFMDEGGGVFATGDHEDLGVTVGGYIPRVRSMRRWFFPNAGPDGEPVAPNGSDATRHDTNREGHDPGWTFEDQSDDVPQDIIPHYFGSGLWSSVHPVLCTSTGPIKVLPDHAHEGHCEVPSNLGGDFTIGSDSFREYPDGPSGQPLAPVVVATATMIPGAEAPRLDKPPVPGGSFGVIGAWDGHKAGDYGRVVVDATWHHFININLIGDRFTYGEPDEDVPKSMGFLHTDAGKAHYNRIKAYFRNIAEWLTPKSRRRCLLHRHIWWATKSGWFQENYSLKDLVYTGELVLGRHYYFRPCDRLNLVWELPELRRRPWFDLIDPPIERIELIEKLRGTSQFEMLQTFVRKIPAALVGAIAIEMAQLDLPAEGLSKHLGDEEADIPALQEAVKVGAERGFAFLEEQLAELGELRALVEGFAKKR